MKTTPLGLKKPEDTDLADLKVFVGDNMDLIDNMLEKRKQTFKQPTAPSNPSDGDIWIDTSV
jgi:hypothetical protein